MDETQMDFIIREAKLADINQIYQIELQCFEPHDRFDLALFKYLLERRMFNLFYVAEIKGKVIGFIICVPKSDQIFEIFTLDIHPEWRKKGIATSLLLEIENIIITNIKKMIELYPDTHSKQVYFLELVVYEKNIAAFELYKKLNFQVVETVMNYYRFGRHGIKMKKELKVED